MKSHEFWIRIAICLMFLSIVVLSALHDVRPMQKTDLDLTERKLRDDTDFLVENQGSFENSGNSKILKASYVKYVKNEDQPQNEERLEDLDNKGYDSQTGDSESELDFEIYQKYIKKLTSSERKDSVRHENDDEVDSVIKSIDIDVGTWRDGNEILRSSVKYNEKNYNLNEDDDVAIISSDENQEYILDSLEERRYNYLDYEDDIVEKGLPDCSEKLKYNAPLLIISTLDGQISGLNYKTGEVIWSHKTNSEGSPMLSSSISKLEVSSRGEFVRLIPSLDGSIYQFDGENVEALPITADTLLHSSFKYNEDTIFSGGKYSEILGILPSTGEIKYTCDNSGCPGRQSTSSGNQILVVRRVSQIVRAIDPKSGSERWNFSVGQHEVNLASTGCESLKSESSKDLSLPSLHFVLPDGVVIAVDEKLRTIWQQKLSSPIINAWSLQDDNLEAIDLFSSNSIPALQPQKVDDEDALQEESWQRQPALYVGVHRGQLYIQQNMNFKKEMNLLLHKIVNTKNPFDQVFPKVNWKPYLASADSRTPVINHGSTSNHPLLLDYERRELPQDLVVRHSVEYPFDNGYYLYNDGGEILNETNYWIPYDESEDESLFGGDITSQIYYVCFQLGPSIYWKVVAFLLVYVFLHYIMMKVLFQNVLNNFQRRVNRRAVATLVMILQNIFREHPQLLAILQRIGMNRLTLRPWTTNQEARDESLSASTSTSTQRQDSNFSSRYTSDFEPVQCLGKGGFGVVFQVKNKLDENEYAVKRIVLPSKESSAERVKREVRALAKLNHTNIVRYYNSWIESPPVGWEEEADSWWKISGAASSLLSPELDETEAAVENSPEPPVVKTKTKSDDSLSDVVNKLNFQHLLPSKDASSFGVSGDCNEVSDEDGGEDSESEENEESNSEVFKKEDDSFEVFFENSSSKGDIDEKSKIYSLGTVVDDGCDKSSRIDSSKITKNDYSKLTCHNRSVSKSDSIVFVDSSEGTKSEGGFWSKNLSKRRKSNRVLSEQSHPDRPASLKIINSTNFSNPIIVRDLMANNPPTPNPRTYLYIQMELCQKESLKDWLFSHPKRDTKQLYSFFNDIVHAVEYVHDRSLMHRDLKPSNIFFSLDGEIKIGDFGLVTTIEDENDDRTPLVDNPSSSVDSTPIPTQKQRTLNAGTHLYMSPEQICGQSYTYKVDIYSLGLIFFEMLVPFSTEMERREVMLKARNKNFPAWFSREFNDVEKLLQLTLHQNPIQRPTTRGIRARQPLETLQKGEMIKEDEHFHLLRQRTHSRTHSGSFNSSNS